jgi:hypothetical protein
MMLFQWLPSFHFVPAALVVFQIEQRSRRSFIASTYTDWKLHAS